MILTDAYQGLTWQNWDDVYIVYQPSSAETHVFNETTESILRCLEQGPLPTDAAKAKAEAALGLDSGGLADDSFAFATMRLEELGLIECLDDVGAAQ